jgi:hypothetical protein
VDPFVGELFPHPAERPGSEQKESYYETNLSSGSLLAPESRPFQNSVIARRHATNLPGMLQGLFCTCRCPWYGQQALENITFYDRFLYPYNYYPKERSSGEIREGDSAWPPVCISTLTLSLFANASASTATKKTLTAAWQSDPVALEVIDLALFQQDCPPG